MPSEKEKRRAALENEPAYELSTAEEATLAWCPRQTELDLFVEWLSAWREMMCAHDFATKVRPI